MLAAPHERSARRIRITAGKHGFEPARIAVTSGETVTLVFTRITERTCAKDVIVHLSELDTVKRELPLSEPVELTLTLTRAGEIGYACRMQDARRCDRDQVTKDQTSLAGQSIRRCLMQRAS